MTQLPKNKEEKLIKHMKPGESGYTVPWAMWVDKNRDCWLNEAYTIYENAGGTVELKIERVKEGYIAYIHDIKYGWPAQNQHGFMSDERDVYGKVVGFNNRDSLESKLKEAIDSDNFEEAAKLRDQLSQKNTNN